MMSPAVLHAGRHRPRCGVPAHGAWPPAVSRTARPARRGWRALMPRLWADPAGWSAPGGRIPRAVRGACRPFQRAAPTLTHLARSLTILALGCALLAQAACGTAARPAAPATPTSPPTATPLPPPMVLYQADWAHGLAGWNATPGWAVAGGALQSDTGAERTISIPYRPTVPDYAVEFTVEVVNVAVNGASYYLVAPQAPGQDGYSARIYNMRTPGPRPFADHPTINVFIDPAEDEDVGQATNGGADFEPGSDYRTYRVVVQGSAVQFYVDGHFEVGTDSLKTPHLSAGPLQLVTKEVSVRFGSLKVMTL
jgi:hypothetical protein